MLAMTLRVVSTDFDVDVGPDGFVEFGLVSHVVTLLTGRASTLALGEVGEVASAEFLGQVRRELLAIREFKARTPALRSEARAALERLDRHIPVSPVTHTASELALRVLVRRQLRGLFDDPETACVVLSAIGVRVSPEELRAEVGRAVVRIDCGDPLPTVPPSASRIEARLRALAAARAAYDDVVRVLGREPGAVLDDVEARVIGAQLCTLLAPYVGGLPIDSTTLESLGRTFGFAMDCLRRAP
jgi:hypothetical protein